MHDIFTGENSEEREPHKHSDIPLISRKNRQNLNSILKNKTF